MNSGWNVKGLEFKKFKFTPVCGSCVCVLARFTTLRTILLKLKAQFVEKFFSLNLRPNFGRKQKKIMKIFQAVEARETRSSLEIILKLLSTCKKFW